MRGKKETERIVVTGNRDQVLNKQDLKRRGEKSSPNKLSKMQENHILLCLSLPTICFFLYSLSSLVRSWPDIFPHPARGTTKAVQLSSEPISSANANMRSAASRGVFAPLAKSEISSSETTEDIPSESKVRWEYSVPVCSTHIVG